MNVKTSPSVQHEHDQWDRLFELELKKKKNSLYSSYWWQIYYKQIANHVNQHLSGRSRILEAGCGSGKASIVLGARQDRTLLDISSEALELSRLIAKRFNVSNVTFVEGNIFQMPFKKETFDLTWNIGVVEHYEPNEAADMIRQMVLVTRKEGYIGVGFPNFRSPPIIKARLLNSPFLRWVPGYRLDTEIAYKPKEIVSMIKKATLDIERKTKSVHIYRVGVPLLVESPKFLVNTLGKIAAKLWPDRHFLYLVIARIS